MARQAEMLDALDARLRAATATVNRLVEAAIALVWSESGAKAMLLGQSEAEHSYETWVEMDELVAALDAARPGWREQGRVFRHD